MRLLLAGRKDANNKMAKFTIAPSAANDLDEIGSYIAENYPFLKHFSHKSLNFMAEFSITTENVIDALAQH